MKWAFYSFEYFYNGRFTRPVSQSIENKVLVLIWLSWSQSSFTNIMSFCVLAVSLILNNHWASTSHRRFNAVSVVFLMNWITLYNKEVFIPLWQERSPNSQDYCHISSCLGDELLLNKATNKINYKLH